MYSLISLSMLRLAQLINFLISRIEIEFSFRLICSDDMQKSYIGTVLNIARYQT